MSSQCEPFLLQSFATMSARIHLSSAPMESVCADSGIHAAIHGKIRPAHVRGLRTGDKRHQRSDLINAPVAVECCGGLLRYRPIARGGIQLRVDRTRLDIVDGDATDRKSTRLNSSHLVISYAV